MCYYSRFLIAVPVALWGLIGLAGCDDDSDGKTSAADTAAGAGGPSGAGQGGSGARGGAGGKGGSAGGAGKSSQAGAGGERANQGAGAGGTPTAAADGGMDGAAAGAGGSGGSGGTALAGAGGNAAPIVYPDLSNVQGKIIGGVNALSGVTFASDGKIYASGDINILDDSRATGDTTADKYRTSVVGHKVVVLRFMPDGTPDSSFGTDGRVIWEGPAGEATSLGLAETDDGSLVVDVNVRYESKRTGVALVKFDTHGQLVTSFGTGGRVDLVFGWTDADLADYPKDAMGAVRYPSDQSWDIKRSNGGTKLVVFASGPAAHGLLDSGVMPAVQRIDNDRFIVRVNANDGAIDPTFNSGKAVVVNTPNDGATGEQARYPSDGGRHGLVESDGSIVGSGYTNYNDGKGNQIVLIRLKADGSFDADFHRERAGQPVLPGVAVFNPVPEDDKGFAECYGVARTAKGYVTTGYGMAYGGMAAASSLGWLPSKSVDMVSTRFTGTAVDTSWGRGGVYAAQSELLGENKVTIFEDRGRSSVIALADNRALMAGRYGQYPAIFVLTDAGKPDAKIKGKQLETNGMLLFPTLTSDKQPATSMIYGLALSPDGKHIVAGTNNHEQGALLAVLEVKSDGTLAAVGAQ
jgi:uncharacterized delta-60 repeat protein